VTRGLTVALVVLGLLTVGAAPGGDPEVPERYISVEEAKALLDLKQRVVFVDVRVKEQFDERHIQGARNISLRDLPQRLSDVPRRDFVALY
jgi:3-mercaptopyruvate sulfurtransferase SseA